MAATASAALLTLPTRRRLSGNPALPSATHQPKESRPPGSKPRKISLRPLIGFAILIGRRR